MDHLRTIAEVDQGRHPLLPCAVVFLEFGFPSVQIKCRQVRRYSNIREPKLQIGSSVYLDALGVDRLLDTERSHPLEGFGSDATCKSVRRILILENEGILRSEYAVGFFVYLTAGAEQAQNVTGRHRELDTRVDAVPYRSHDIEVHTWNRPLREVIVAGILTRAERRGSSSRRKSVWLPGTPSGA